MGGRKAEGDISAASTSVNRWRCGAGLPAMRPRFLAGQGAQCLKMRRKPKDICDLRMTPSRIAQDISRCTFLSIAGHTLMLRLEQWLDQLASETKGRKSMRVLNKILFALSCTVMAQSAYAQQAS